MGDDDKRDGLGLLFIHIGIYAALCDPGSRGGDGLRIGMGSRALRGPSAGSDALYSGALLRKLQRDSDIGLWDASGSGL